MKIECEYCGYEVEVNARGQCPNCAAPVKTEALMVEQMMADIATATYSYLIPYPDMPCDALKW